MSDEGSDIVPIMRPEQARDISRAMVSLADQYEDAAMMVEANRMLRKAKWWMTYALALGKD